MQKKKKKEGKMKDQIFENTSKEKECSELYSQWVRQAGLPPLTNTQKRFAEWLLLEENSSVISQIGNLDVIFTSVRHWLKSKK